MRPARKTLLCLALGLLPLAAAAAPTTPLVHLGGAAVAPGDGRAETIAFARFVAVAGPWRLSQATLALFRVVSVRTLVAGGVRVDLRASVDGRDVEGTDVHVLLTDDLRPVAVSVGPAVPRLRARRGLPGTLSADGAREVAVAGRSIRGRVGASPILTVAPDGAVIDAWRVAFTVGDADARLVDVDARTGRVLRDVSLTSDTSYGVYADADGRPADSALVDGTPAEADPDDIAVSEPTDPTTLSVEGLDPNPDGGVDPWLPAGATTLAGNNVHAAVWWDEATGTEIEGTAPDTFTAHYEWGVDAAASDTQQAAAATQAFYVVNWAHDLYHVAGFDEAAGNAQADNLGRGGLDGDAIELHMQEGYPFQAVNNASMTTNADGTPSILRVYVRVGPGRATFPGGTVATGVAAFGPQGETVTAPLQWMDAACGEVPTEDFTGRIAVADIPDCPFYDLALAAEAAGAVAFVTLEGGEDALVTMTCDVVGGADPDAVGIPGFSVRLEDLALVDDAAESGAPVTLAGSPRGDVGLDSDVVAHEFGHMLHHRLVGNGQGAQEAAMSEGWGDIVALSMVLREGDPLDGAYPIMPYLAESISPAPRYHGIRRAPYSSDPSVNAFTFRYLTSGAGVPTEAPTLAKYDESEVHNAGEIWASALWDAYVGLQAASPTSFEDTREHWAALLVSGLGVTPVDATYLEGRDAILAAALASSVEEATLVAGAFAGRGMGTCAVAPDRTSSTFEGIEEDFGVHPVPAVLDVSVAETDGCDGDDVLDAGEAGGMRVVVRNEGFAPMVGASLTLSMDDAAVDVGGPVAIPDLGPWEETTVEVPLVLGEAVAPMAVAGWTLTLDAPDACAGLQLAGLLALDADVTPGASETDTFDTSASGWDAEPGWAQARAGGDSVWLAADSDGEGDTRLVSPTFAVAGELRVHVEHAYSLQDLLGSGVDAGVVEISLDGGPWEDVSGWADPGYPMTVAADTSALNGRPAFSGDSPGYPALTGLDLDFGAALAGHDVQLAFRLATDATIGGEGWTVSSVTVEGAASPPFAAVEADPHVCAEPDETPEETPEATPDDEARACGCATMGTSTTGTATDRTPGMRAGIAALVVGLMALRRRR